jgi:hypothetical protein
MTTSYRPVMAPDGTVIHSGLTTDDADYADMNLNKLILGVILDVYASDYHKTRSAQQTIDRHGHTHECTVLGVNDGSSAYTVYENVIITPDAPSGLDDYIEKLPRGSKSLVDGTVYDSSLRHIDPYDLDGDWCVLGFLGGRIEAPFIVRWWPHARNTYDTATSGEGSDGEALVQNRRFFRRMNGIETVVTGQGNIVVSTTRANTFIDPGSDNKFGRFARTTDEDEGGSIRINIKPSQYFELSFNPQDEGIGNVDVADEELPQLNPIQGDPEAASERPESYIYADRDQVDFYIPDTFNAVVGTDVNISADNNATLEATNTLQLEGELIKIGENAEADPTVLGEKLRTFLSAVEVLSPFGPLRINPAHLLAPSSIYDNTLSTKSVVE